MSTIINSYIPPQVFIVRIYISHPIIIIRTDTTLLFFINLFLYKTRRYRWSQKSTTVTWVMGGKVSGLRPIFTYPFNINYCSLVARERVGGLLWPRSTPTNITTMIPPVITIGRVAGLKIPMSTTSAITIRRVDGLKGPMPTDFISQRQSKNFLLLYYIVVVTAVGGIMASLIRPISYTSITTHRAK